MSKWFPYFFLVIFCVGLLTTGRAQDLDSLSVIAQDTVYETTTSSDENYKFKEHPGENKVDTRNVNDANVKTIKSGEDYWYVDQTPPRETSKTPKDQRGEKKRSRGLFNIPWLNTLFWIILIGGFIALLVWFLSTSDIRLFRKRSQIIDEGNPEEAPEDIFEMNFEREIQKAIEAGNFRQAVRLMYLRTLRDLSARNLISYTHEKTNSDYLFQLASTSYYKNFFRLTRNFDYTWYGHFELSPDNFALIQNDFSSFKQQLS